VKLGDDLLMRDFFIVLIERGLDLSPLFIGESTAPLFTQPEIYFRSGRLLPLRREFADTRKEEIELGYV